MSWECDTKPLSRNQTRISARRAQAKESRLLEIATHAPLLCVRTLNVRVDSQQVAEYSVSLTRADRLNRDPGEYNYNISNQ